LVTVAGDGPRAQRLLDEFVVGTPGVTPVDTDVFGATHERRIRLYAETEADAENFVYGALATYGARPGEFTVTVERIRGLTRG
jgi:hypothetical protein